MVQRRITGAENMIKKTIFVLAGACALAVAADNPEEIKQRNDGYGNELEQYFRDYLVTKYPERAAGLWHRSYDNERAFLKSGCVIAELPGADHRMPLRAGIVFAGILVLPALFGGDAEKSEIGVVGLLNLGVLAEKADEFY